MKFSRPRGYSTGRGPQGRARFVLRSCSFGPLMAGVISKIVFDHLRADDDHRVSIAQISNNWKLRCNEKVWLAPDRRKDFAEIRPSRVDHIPFVIWGAIF